MQKSEDFAKLSDENLVLKAGAGSRDCFEELVSRYSGRLFHFFRKKISSDQETEDLIQEAFLKVYRNLHRYDPKWKFSTWLYTIASRLAISYFRSVKIKTPEISAKNRTLDPEEALVKKEASQNLWATAKELSPSQYEVLWLFYAEGMSIKEVAKVLKKSQVTVRVQLHRARLELAGLINQPEQSGDMTPAPSPPKQKLSLL